MTLKKELRLAAERRCRECGDAFRVQPPSARLYCDHCAHRRQGMHLWRMVKDRQCLRCGVKFSIDTGLPSGRRLCRKCQHARQAHGSRQQPPDAETPSAAKVEAYLEAKLLNDTQPVYLRETDEQLRRRLL